jgi:NitT/TauT family transport system ATP-binding protein
MNDQPMNGASAPTGTGSATGTAGGAPAISVENLTISYETNSGGQYVAVRDASFSVAREKFVAIVGPSGCGKSTVLNAIAGLIPPTAGSISVMGEPPLRGTNEHAVYMFQQDALLPWKTVWDNVALGLRLGGRLGPAERRLVTEWLTRVRLEDFGGHYPRQLSGGMRKRAYIAQTWILRPDIVLMDEPLSALDVHTRRLVEGELLEIWQATGNTVVFVTHDLEEAITLADQVIVLSAGPAAGVVGVYDVPLGRPRDLIDLKTDPRFAEIYASIWESLRNEVVRSYGSHR